MALLDEFVIKLLVENNYVSLSESEWSDSDLSLILSDEEPRKKRVRIQNFVEDVVRSYSNVEFKSHFRMSRETVYKLIGLLDESHFLTSYHSGRENITAEKAFLLSLWYFSNQETFREISDRFNATYSSVHRCLRRTLKFLLSKKKEIIRWPAIETTNIITNAFKSKQGMVNVIGAIDGSHVEINKPSYNQDSYINRKGYHSLLIQGIVDHDHSKRFIDVFCGEPGSMHDARRDYIGQYFLLGDSAYPNLHWIVTPFKDNGRLSREQKIFNYKHSATRIVVENAFGLLKGRFRRLHKLENIDIGLCTEIIMGACILHNICINNEDFLETEVSDDNQPEHTFFENSSALNCFQQHNRQQEVFDKLFSSECE